MAFGCHRAWYCRLKILRSEPGTNGFNAFGLALEGQPVSGWQTDHGKVVAGVAHGLSDAIVVDVAETVEVPVEEEYGLAEASSVGSSMRVGQVRGIVQIPGVARTKAGNAECVDEGVEVGDRPKRGIRGYCGRAMRRAEPSSIARDHRSSGHFADGRGFAAAIDRRKGRWDVRIEIGDGLLEVGEIEAVVVPLTIRVLVGRVESPVDERQEAG